VGNTDNTSAGNSEDIIASIQSALAVLVAAGQVVEIRCPSYTQNSAGDFAHTRAGFFDHQHLKAAATHAWQMEKFAPAVYVTLNPVDLDLLARCANTTKKAPRGGFCAEDSNVIRRFWILIDADPKRLAGVSTTDAEKALAAEMIGRVRDFLLAADFMSLMVEADSGNGYHLLVAVDLPAEDRGMVEAFLHLLAAKFNTDTCQIDTSVHNPARITKLYGTLVKKGSNTAARPHRRSALGKIINPDSGRIDAESLAKFLSTHGCTQKEGRWYAAGKEPQTRARPSSNGNGKPKASSTANGSAWFTQATGGERSRIVYRAKKYIENFDHSVQGNHGSDPMFSVCLALYKGFLLTEDEGWPLVENYNRIKCSPQWSDAEIRHKIDSARKANRVPDGYLLKDDSQDVHFTDMGNAQRLVVRHGTDLLHCHPWKKWLIWDGTRWRPDDTGEAQRRVKDTIAAMYRDAAESTAQCALELEQLADVIGIVSTEDSNDAIEKAKALQKKQAWAKRIVDWALESEDKKHVNAMLDLARSDVPVLPSQLDADIWSLNCANGTIDLRTGTLRPHRREDMNTKLCPTRYVPTATCPRFLQTIESIFDSDTELIGFVQRWLGYSLTGDVREQAIPIWWGTGSNGKTTFLTAIQEILGDDYSGTVPVELIMKTNSDQHPTILADLFGKRLMIAAEIEKGRKLNESRVKMLTGGDIIKARRMREDLWQFAPTHKLILLTNHKPVVAGTDHAIWRRLRLVPFNVQFLDPLSPDNAGKDIPANRLVDRTIADALKLEQEGILAWMVRGCLAWQASGIPYPASVRAATAEYRQAEDVLAAFIAECCVTGGSDYRVRSSDLYARYRKWSEDAGEQTMSQKAFGEAMTEKKFERKTSNGTWYLNIAILETSDVSEEEYTVSV
jgi:P4 family phage/plasmid primase-like protien